MNYRTNITSQTARIFLLLLFCGYFISITFFPHTHVVDGVKVVHSHPYKGDPSKHQHTGQGLILINLLDHLVAVVPAMLIINRTRRIIESRLIRQTIFIVPVSRTLRIFPRAPAA